MTRRIYLIGMRGCGKSTLGRALAEALEFTFVDVDELIETTCNRSIPEIFRDEGIEAFREHERHALEVAQGYDRCVIATGGGCVELEGIGQLLADALVVHLYVPKEVALARLRRSPRPPLTDSPLEKEYEDVYLRRAKAYHALGGAPLLTDRPLKENIHACKQLWQQYLHHHLR